MNKMPSMVEAEEAISSREYLIGSGVDRTVYRLPESRWAYKVDYYADGAVNEAEYKAYLKFKDELPEGIAFPEMHLLEDGKTLATEFILNEVEEIADKNSECDFGWHYCNNRAKCWVTPYIDKIRSAGIVNDMHGGNVRINSGKIYIIDLGEYY